MNPYVKNTFKRMKTNYADMKNRKKKIVDGWVALIIFVMGVASCSDSAEHYKVSEEVESRTSLWEMISSQPELSRFAALLKQYSYDRILSGNQTYTVWAPDNNHLADMDTEDSIAVIRVITTHIARYAYPASEATTKFPEIYMLNAKKQPFLSSGNSYALGGVELQPGSRIANNGVLHVLNGQIPFFPNIWQMMENENFDSIRNYLYSFNKREFMRGMSTQIDINEEGMIVYDSVFTTMNSMWYTYTGAKGIGYLNMEDSTYTMILPDNTAWTEVYNRYYPVFRPDQSLPNADSIQHANMQYAIVQDLVFRGAISNPNAYGENDSILSTRNAVIKNPARIFSGAQPIQTSNGWIYTTSSLNYDRTDSYIKPIKIEAEMSKGRMHNESRDMGLIYSFYVDNAEISNKGYLYVKDQGKNPNEVPVVSFEIPEVLNTAYDIYVAFLSPSFANSTSEDTTITRVKVAIQQWNRKGPKSSDLYWGNGVNSGAGQTLASFGDSSSKFITSKRGIALIKAGTYTFPFANINEDENVFRVRVSSALTRTDNNSKDPKFNKEMRIDYILLVPSSTSN
jgi:uncharacterized surface protein with fasciclin (FAS1) repeats